GDTRIAERADEHGIEIMLQHGKAVRRNGSAVFEVSVRRPVEVRELNGCARCFDDSQRCRNDFLADSITRNNRDAFLLVASLHTAGHSSPPLILLRLYQRGSTRESVSPRLNIPK